MKCMKCVMELPVHPRTGLQAVGIVGGRPVWPILGGAPDDGDKPDGGQGGDSGQGGSGGGGSSGGQQGGGQQGGGQAGQAGAEKRFTQAELDAIVQDRVARERTTQEKKYANYGELQQKASDYDKLKQESETDAEKRVREASEKARGDVLAEMRPRLVLAELRAAAAGRIENERFDTLVDDLDLTKYLAGDGSVDMDKVRKKVDAWAPPKKDDGEGGEQEQQRGPRRPRPDGSQGSGRTPPADAQRGIDEARRRYGDRARGPAAASK